jgi:hypothetical protein
MPSFVHACLQFRSRALINRISLKPSSDPEVRRACRVLAMVHELHKAGYQRLRISGGMSLSGVHWQCHITPASNIEKNGWEIMNWEANVATYSTEDDDRYFGFADASGSSARMLAVMFQERFPDILEQSLGQDWAYAGWFTEALGAAEQGRFPLFFADYDLEPEPERMPPPPPSARGTPLRIISSQDLRLEDVPESGARFEEIEPFCLSFDGYAEHSIEQCAEIKQRVLNGGLAEASMDDLRITIFIIQRKIRWNDHMPVQAVDVDEMRPVIEEIRSRIAGNSEFKAGALRALPRKLTWALPSKFDPLSIYQSQVVASSIQELNDVLPWEFDVDTIPEIDQSKFNKIFEIAEYLRFMNACYACGFVTHDTSPDFPLDRANMRPEEVLGNCDLPALRHYIHSLCRDERWSDGYSSPVLKALISGALQLVGRRLCNE